MYTFYHPVTLCMFFLFFTCYHYTLYSVNKGFYSIYLAIFNFYHTTSPSL